MCEFVDDESSTEESFSKLVGEFEIKSDTSGVGFSDINASLNDADFGDTFFADNNALVGASFTPLITARNPLIHSA